MRPHAKTLVLLLAGSLLLAGCKSNYGEPKTRVNHYPQCYQPVQQLREDENLTARSTAVGAAGGALLGALIGGLATGKVEGALAGAVAGGATGAVAGNIYGKSEQKNRDAAYLHAYARQLGADAASMNRAAAAAKVAGKCYDDQFRLAANLYRSGRISRLEFQDRYAEIRSGLEETAYILNDTVAVMAKRDAEYQRALAADYVNAPSRASAGKKAPPRASGQSEITTRASAWKDSHQELEKARHDTNARISRLDEAVRNELG